MKKQDTSSNQFFSNRTMTALVILLVLAILWVISVTINRYSSPMVTQAPSGNTELSSFELVEGELVYLDEQWQFREVGGVVTQIDSSSSDTSLLSLDSSLDYPVVIFADQKNPIWKVVKIQFLEGLNDAPGGATEAITFVNDYIDTIQRGSYASLLSTYWVEDIAKDIIKTCQNPLGGDSADAEALWRSCGYFRGYTVNIIEISEQTDFYTAKIEFIDEQGEKVTSTLTSNNDQFDIYIQKTLSGLRTRNWKFF